MLSDLLSFCEYESSPSPPPAPTGVLSTPPAPTAHKRERTPSPSPSPPPKRPRRTLADTESTALSVSSSASASGEHQSTPPTTLTPSTPTPILPTTTTAKAVTDLYTTRLDDITSILDRIYGSAWTYVGLLDRFSPFPLILVGLKPNTFPAVRSRIKSNPFDSLGFDFRLTVRPLDKSPVMVERVECNYRLHPQREDRYRVLKQLETRPVKTVMVYGVPATKKVGWREVALKRERRGWDL